MRYSWMKLIALVVCSLALPSVGLAQGNQVGKSPPPDISSKSGPGLTCKALGWKADNIDTRHVTSWEHGMNTPIALVSVYFSPGGDDAVVYPVSTHWTNNDTGNPITIEITRDRVNLHIEPGVPLRGIWNARAGGGVGRWTHYTVGFWNVVLCE